MGKWSLTAEDIKGIKDDAKNGNSPKCPTLEENDSYVQSADGPGYGKWTEDITIRDTSWASPKNDPNNEDKKVMLIKYDITGGKPNGGRGFTSTVYLDHAKLASESTAWMVRRSLGVVNSLLEATGLDISEGIDEYEPYFNGEKPLIGAKVLMTLNKRKYVKNGVANDSIEPIAFFPAS